MKTACAIFPLLLAALPAASAAPPPAQPSADGHSMKGDVTPPEANEPQTKPRPAAATQFIILNIGPEKFEEDLARISQQFKLPTANHVRIGISTIFCYLQHPRAKTKEALRRFLRLAQEHNMPVVIQLDGEHLYQAAVNADSCPGWSFYRHADDPGKDAGVQAALKKSDAPAWAAVEWLYTGPRETAPWCRALETTLAQPRCRFLCIFNWSGICDSPEILNSVRLVTAEAKGRHFGE